MHNHKILFPDKTFDKIFARSLSFILTLALTCSLLPARSVSAAETAKQGSQDNKEGVDADPETEETIQEIIEINSVKDFLAFAANCSLDSWSADKRVLLNTDISLSDTEFDSIPVFTGTFDGQNHTISGFQYRGNGYVGGLFRYIGVGGLVENLNVTGEIIAADEKECIGGLCGINYGNIQNCSFKGNVSGRTTIGGLVGVNEPSGAVRDCFSGGHITGYYATGGIAGTNHGLLSHCTNRANINNDREWVEEDDEMGAGIFFSIDIGEDETELFSGVDTGGIVGYSDGIVTRCMNYGTIGYEHTGYNIGGIAGRQSGILSLCSNRGNIYGRKDIGGIVGQMEPYIEVDEAQSLRNAVDELHDLIAKTLDDMEDGKNVSKRDLDSLAASSDSATDAGDALAGQLADFVDDNLDQAQAMTDRLSDVMEMLPLVFDDVYSAEENFASASRSLMLIGDDIREIGHFEGDYVETDYSRLTLLSTVGGNLLSIQQYPSAGETVYILAEPATDYQLSSIAAYDAHGSRIGVNYNGDNSYSFVMPEANVKVEAYFSYNGTTTFTNGSDNALINPDESDDPDESDEEDGTDIDGTENDSTVTGNPSTDKADPDKDQTNPDDGKSDPDDEKTDSDSGSGDGSDGGSSGSGSGSGSGNDGGSSGSGDGSGSGSDGGSSGSGSGSDGGNDGSSSDSGSGSGSGNDNGSSDSEDDSGNGDASGSSESGSGTGSGSGNTGSADSGHTSGGGAPDDDSNLEVRVSSSFYKPERRLSVNNGTLMEVNTITPSARAQTAIQLMSNLSGNASYQIDGGTATVTVIPDGGYTVNGTPSVSVNGQSVSVSRSYQSEYAYSFSVNGGGLYQVNINFQKLDKSQTVGGAKGEIDSAIRQQQAAAEKVNAIMREIQDSGTVTDDQLKELEKALEEMSNATSAVLSNLSVVSNIVGQHAVEITGNIGDEMASAMDYLQSAVDSIKSATRDARSIVDYVNGQPNIRFSKLGGEFDVNRKNLHEQLKKMSESIQNLSNDASNFSDVINDDLRAVNDQINLVFNLLADNLTNYGEVSVEELYEDVNIEEIDSITTGKTDNCVNRGIVQGDINIGGIAGAMSIDEEDPEDSAAGNIDYQIGRRYFTKCIITDSVNEGYITAKKDGAGGIVGYMKHGVVTDSEGYGSVESTEGSYVGGICGESLTIIQNCYALCCVSGDKNVGGIAGFADTIKDCYAMADCNAKTGRKGAIAGQTVQYENALNEEENKISGNYYVGENLYGIDNVSYTGIAEPISYEELLTVVNLPTAFRHLKVTFRVDDSYLGTQEVAFGESLSTLEYPDIPHKEGFYGVWPDYSDQIMTGNLMITGEYKENVTVIQSKEAQAAQTNDSYEKPYALVEQRFTEDTLLNVSLGTDKTPPEKIHNRPNVIYDVSLENAAINDQDTFAIRLYNPYEDAEVWEYRDGTWSKLESKARGQYLQVDMCGTRQTFCVAQCQSKTSLIAVCAAGGIILAALILVLFKKTKAGRRKRSKETK